MKKKIVIMNILYNYIFGMTFLNVISQYFFFSTWQNLIFLVNEENCR